MLNCQVALTLSMVVLVAQRSEELGVARPAEPAQRAERLDTVLPRELLSLVSTSGVVPNWDLVYPVTQPEHAGCDFWFDVESVALQVEALPELAAEDLAAGFHVRDVAVEEKVGEKRDGAVAHDEPEAVRGVAREAANTENDVGSSLR